MRLLIIGMIIDCPKANRIYNVSSDFHARCHRDFNSSANDYIFGNKELVFNNVQALNTDSNGSTPYQLSGYIRGYSSLVYDLYWWNRGSLNQSPHIDSDACGIPGYTSSEDNFNWENGPLNTNHLCHTSAGEIVWMLR